MTELESLALLIADLSAQVRALQAENAQLRECDRTQADALTADNDRRASKI